MERGLLSLAIFQAPTAPWTTLGDGVLTIASENFCFSSTDLPYFTCIQEIVSGISSFSSV